MPPSLYPLRFRPVLRRLIWGGRRLGTVLGKPIGPEADYAESWEVADHEHGRSVVADGPLEGTDLRELIERRGAELLGPELAGVGQFPLLVKFLDAHDVLSVQVHPDDALARRLMDDNGKTEAWVVLHAEPGSPIYAGLKAGVTAEAFAAAIDRGAVEPLLHRIAPRAGDCIFIPAGTVHAIGAGVMLAEVQQMSDATLRVFDWNRAGADGKARPLHVAQAMLAIDFGRGPVDPVRPRAEPIEGGRREHLAACRYFRLDRLRIEGPARVGSARRFTLLIGLEGGATVRSAGADCELQAGRTLLLPAGLGACELVPQGSATVLVCEPGAGA